MGYLIILALLVFVVPLAIVLTMAGSRRRRQAGPRDSVTVTEPAAEGAAVGKGPADAKAAGAQSQPRKDHSLSHGHH